MTDKSVVLGVVHRHGRGMGTTLACALLAVAASGCGQRGPLVLPGAQPASQARAPASGASGAGQPAPR